MLYWTASVPGAKVVVGAIGSLTILGVQIADAPLALAAPVRSFPLVDFLCGPV